MADEEEPAANPDEGGPPEGGPEDAPNEAEGGADEDDGTILTQAVIQRMIQNRTKFQEINNTIKDMKCQDLFAPKTQLELTDEMIRKMRYLNCDFLDNINEMWGKTQDFLDDLKVNRILSSEISHVPSSNLGLAPPKAARSESFEKLCSKKIPRVIVCGSDDADVVPRIIVCEDKETVVPPGDCPNVSNKNLESSSRLNQSQYTSYGGRFC